MAAQYDSGSFDFDEWLRLAENDPQGFEIKRQFILEEAIASAPERTRMRLQQLQWKLDRIRETAATPMAACVRMQELMWESLIGQDGLVETLNGLPEEAPPAVRKTAQLLVFPR